MPPLPKPARETTVREAVESIRALTPRLNAITDRANETVRWVEQFLNEECGVGLAAHVYVTSEPLDPSGLTLEYRRVGPRFRISLVENAPDGEEVSVKPWADSSRTDKLLSFKKLPELLTKIAAKVEADIKEAEKTTNEIVSIIASLQVPASPERR